MSTELTLTENTFLTLDKGSVRDIAKSFVEKYTDGYNSSAEGLLFAKKLGDLSEEIKNNLSDYATNEVKLGTGEKAIIKGATATVQMVGVRYDFKETNDKVWLDLNQRIKEREEFLKALKTPMELVDTDTGETYTVYPPIRSGKQAVVFKY